MAEPPDVNLTSALPDDIREGIAVNNIKTIGEGPAFYSNLLMANAVQSQQQLSSLGMSILARATELITEKQLEEGGVALAALQQMIKTAQTTPPPTP